MLIVQKLMMFKKILSVAEKLPTCRQKVEYEKIFI